MDRLLVFGWPAALSPGPPVLSPSPLPLAFSVDQRNVHLRVMAFTSVRLRLSFLSSFSNRSDAGKVREVSTLDPLWPPSPPVCGVTSDGPQRPSESVYTGADRPAFRQPTEQLAALAVALAGATDDSQSAAGPYPTLLPRLSSPVLSPPSASPPAKSASLPPHSIYRLLPRLLVSKSCSKVHNRGRSAPPFLLGQVLQHGLSKPAPSPARPPSPFSLLALLARLYHHVLSTFRPGRPSPTNAAL